MIKQLFLIVIVSIGLIIMPGTIVAATFNHHHSDSIHGLGFGIGAILKFKQHKDNPTQFHFGQHKDNPTQFHFGQHKDNPTQFFHGKR